MILYLLAGKNRQSYFWWREARARNTSAFAGYLPPTMPLCYPTALWRYVSLAWSVYKISVILNALYFFQGELVVIQSLSQWCLVLLVSYLQLRLVPSTGRTLTLVLIWKRLILKFHLLSLFLVQESMLHVQTKIQRVNNNSQPLLSRISLQEKSE